MESVNTGTDRSPLQHYIQVVNSIYPLTDAGLDALVSHAKEVTFKKKHRFYQEGEIADKIYFIHKGVIRVCYHQQDKLVVDRFEKEGSFFGGNMSYITDQPVEFSFESLENCVMIELDSSDFKQLCKKHKDIQQLHSIYLAQHFKRYTDLVNTFRGITPDEKYHKFLEVYGNLIHRITLKNVAAFLGVKHETLSRIRSRFNTTETNPMDG
jgi:CRP/FNR family transcriptional regulator, anaerobic regulatory protein